MPAIGKLNDFEFRLEHWDGGTSLIKIIPITDAINTATGESLSSNVMILHDCPDFSDYFDTIATFKVNDTIYNTMVSSEEDSLYMFLKHCVGKLVMVIQERTQEAPYGDFQSGNNLPRRQETRDPNSFYSNCDW